MRTLTQQLQHVMKQHHDNLMYVPKHSAAMKFDLTIYTHAATMLSLWRNRVYRPRKNPRAWAEAYIKCNIDDADMRKLMTYLIIERWA